MDALTLLNEHMDMHKVLEHYNFDKISPEGSMIRSCCKLHGGSNPSAFVVNTSNNLWYCHTGDCGGGDAYNLVMHIEEIPFRDAVFRVAEILGVDIENFTITERKASHIKELKSFIALMKSRKKKDVHAYSIKEEIRAVKKFRAFLPETLQHFGLGFVESVDLMSRDGKPYTLRNRLVFPIMQGGVQVGISFRKVKANDYPKWSHQPASFETKEVLYNYDNVQQEPIITIVEGIPDVWACYEAEIPAVCTFGAHLTDEQYRLLMRTGADLVWGYDGDEAGVNARNKACAQFRYKANQWYIPFHVEEDPDSISREELRKRYDSRIKC